MRSGQVLILGTGFDTRAYRLKGIEKKKVFEIDLPDIQQIKMKKLRKYFKALPSQVSFILIDFNNEKLEHVINQSGFDSAKPAWSFLRL